MNLGLAKEIALYLIDENMTSDSRFNYLEKMPAYFDAAQKEMSTVRPIIKYFDTSATGGVLALPLDFKEAIRVIGASKNTPFEVSGGIRVSEDGNYTLEYYAFPTDISDTTPDTYVFEVPLETHEALPYYVAAMCIAPEDMGQYSLLMGLYSSKVASFATTPKIRVWGGIDV